MIDQKLLTLLAAIKYQNYSKAADALSLTQPAVSTHIKLLEQEFNTKIFDKNYKNLTLTSDGEIIVKFARRVTSLYELVNEQLKNEKNHIQSLTIGMTHTAENSNISLALAKYATQNSNDKSVKNIKIISDDTKNIYQKLKTYEVDIAVVEGSFNDNDFCHQLLDIDSLVLIVSNNNPLCNKQKITLKDLKKEKLILRLPNSDSRSRFEACLKNNNMNIDDFNIILELDSISQIKNLVSNDYGVSIIAKSSCKNEIAKHKFTMLDVENLSINRKINLIYHQSFEHLQFIKEFIDLYKNI
ncbi:MAG: LysR family transcriptional regulator [Bacilli bacterium]|nr:LysR family transcriptional regulator [Bacilli bacterium]